MNKRAARTSALKIALTFLVLSPMLCVTAACQTRFSIEENQYPDAAKELSESPWTNLSTSFSGTQLTYADKEDDLSHYYSIGETNCLGKSHRICALRLA